jgi:hypothetical protein
LIAILLFYPLVIAGFAEARDFTLAFTSRLLADVGVSRIDIVGTLAGPELSYALALNPPITLAAHTLLFRLLGDAPAAQTAATLAFHLLVVLAAMAVAGAWREDRAAALVAGTVAAVHPVVAGAVHGIAELGVVLAAFFVLAAIGLTIRYVRYGARILLGPLLLAGLFAVAADAAGLVVLPACLLAAIAAPAQRRLSRAVSLAAPVAVAVGALMPLAYLLALRGPRLYAAQLAGPGARQLGDCAAWAMRALILPADFTWRGGHAWLGRLIVAVLAAGLLTLTALRARRRPVVLIWPLLAGLALWPKLIALGPPSPEAEAAVFGACYLPVIFTTLWLAELTPGSRRRRIVFVLALLAVLAPQARVMVRTRVERAELVNRLGREMNAFVRQAPTGADVLFPVAPLQMRLMETAFLAAQYQAEAARQIRYRLVMGGRVLAAPRATPLGENQRGFARLPFTDDDLVLGFSADGRQIVDLSGQIRAKMKLAEDVIREEKHGPPVWPLLDEGVLNRWDVGNKCRGLLALAPDDFGWFVEGYFYRLHPHLGQVSF